MWLNEGWTVYIERRVMAELHGEARRDFSAIIGWQGLIQAVDRFGKDHDYTRLVYRTKDIEPDEASSNVAYEKGSTFLLYLENLMGKETFDPFIPHYFRRFRRTSVVRTISKKLSWNSSTTGMTNSTPLTGTCGCTGQGYLPNHTLTQR